MFSSSPCSQLLSLYGFDSRATERLSNSPHSNSPVQILSCILRDHYCFQHNRSIPACYCVVGTHVQENPLFSFTDGFSPCEPATRCRLTRAKSGTVGCWVAGTVLSDDTCTVGGENRVVIQGQNIKDHRLAQNSVPHTFYFILVRANTKGHIYRTSCTIPNRHTAL
jgi:hypothetical protein